MAAFAAVSFAEGITFGAWLRALAAPVASNGDETITAASNSWGGAPRTARLNVTGIAADGNAGYNFGVYSSTKAGDFSFDAPDEHNLWVKPLDIVKVSYGKYDNNTLRGDCAYGSWNWLRPTAWIAGDEGLLMSGNGDTGLMVEVTPTEELYIQALVPITNENVKAGTTYKNLRGGFAYTVPGLVKVKGQYIGKGEASDDDAGTDGNSNCTIEAEVDVLAVEGLFAGVGFQYNNIKDAALLSAAAGEPENQMKIAAGVSYQVMPELKVSASGAFFTYYKLDYIVTDVKVDPRFQAGVGVDYDLGDGLAANADFRYLSPVKVDGEKADNTDSIAFSVGVTKAVSSNGYIGVAFQGVTNSGSLGGVAGVPNDDGEAKNFVWAIPVALSVWF